MELPNVELKLDHNFISECAQDVVKKEQCGAMIEMAHKYGRRIVAVGIDQLPDLQALIRMGCDLGQGLLLGPPLPTMKIRQMIKINTSRKSGG
jgi:EAL domain-containing protein (putative c-di-GMP-specific phosphodiesterase class I)